MSQEPKWRVYVAGPLTQGSIPKNISNAIKVADHLWKMGYVPYVPHLNHYWEIITPRPYSDWLEYDIVWLNFCDVMLRLPGCSPGADIEETYAKKHKIPIYSTFLQLTNYFPTKETEETDIGTLTELIND